MESMEEGAAVARIDMITLSMGATAAPLRWTSMTDDGLGNTPRLALHYCAAPNRPIAATFPHLCLDIRHSNGSIRSTCFLNPLTVPPRVRNAPGARYSESLAKVQRVYID
jgi:hypothetical protein